MIGTRKIQPMRRFFQESEAKCGCPWKNTLEICSHIAQDTVSHSRYMVAYGSLGYPPKGIPPYFPFEAKGKIVGWKIRAAFLLTTEFLDTKPFLKMLCL